MGLHGRWYSAGRKEGGIEEGEAAIMIPFFEGGGISIELINML